MPNAELRSSGPFDIRHSTFAIGRRSSFTAALLFLTVIYAILQVGFVRPYLPADPRPNLARPLAIAPGDMAALAAWRDVYHAGPGRTPAWRMLLLRHQGRGGLGTFRRDWHRRDAGPGHRRGCFLGRFFRR